jgi:tRNA (guanosine-2'-O-)-methyltransferase
VKLSDKELVQTPGLMAYLQSFITPRRQGLINEVLDERTRYLTLVLEDVLHSQNANAVIRSCECFGIQDMCVIENKSKFRANRGVVQGSAKWISLQRFNQKEINNTKTCFDNLRQKGYAIVATTLRKEKYTPIDKIPLDKKLAVCFGCEETGLSDFAHAEADYFINLPMYGFTESFNISVSAALVLQALSRRLRQDDIDIGLSEEEKTELRIDWFQKSIKNSDLLIKRYLKNHVEN